MSTIQLSRSRGPVSNTALEHWTPSFDELTEALSEPQIGSKDGSYFVRGPFNGTAKRADEHITEAHVVVLDGDSRIDTDTGELLAGAPHPSLVHEALTDEDVCHFIYTSHSHGDPKKGERYRVVVPAALGSDHNALLACVDHLIGIINKAGVPLANVKENYAWAQAWFMPRIRDKQAEFLTYCHDSDEALDVAAILAAWQKARPKVASKICPERKRHHPGFARSPIGRYVTEQGSSKQIDDRLTEAGYILRASASLNDEPAYRYLHPESSSGNPGVMLFCSKSGVWRVTSFHGDHDPLAELDAKTGKHLAHDAFDLLRILKHNGDLAAALESIGVQPKPQADPVPEQDPQGRELIRVYGGSLAGNTREAVKALAATAPPVCFQRGSMLARVAHLPELTEVQGVTVPKGTATLVPIEQTDMRLRLAEAAVFEKARKGEEGEVEWYPTDPPISLAQTVLASAGDWQGIPILLSLAEAPIIRADGSLHDAPGYDPQSRLFYEAQAPALKLSTNPTWEDAGKAARYLLRPFSEFPFADRLLDESVVLALLLTLAQRPQIGLAPLFGVSATSPGSGKGLLIEVANLIVRGRDAAIMPPPGGQNSEEETRKRITALLMQGVSSVLLDNWTTAIGGDSMNTLLTSSSWSDRVLGKSQAITLPARVTWTATGNNLSVRGDMVRRTLLATLDAATERPEQREFAVKNLTAKVQQERQNLLSALYTVLRAYRQAGEPEANGKLLGRFEEWSRSVAAPIRWLGWPDPTDSQERLRADDPEAQKLNALLLAWFDVFGKRVIGVADLIEVATAEFLPQGVTAEARFSLREALEDIAGERGSFNKRALGRYMKRFSGRVACGLKIFADTSRKDRVLYQLVKIG